MNIEPYITHYFEYENGPFRSICDLSKSETKEIIEKERDAEVGFNRFSYGEEFFDFRKLADDLLLDMYAEKFGKKAPRRPYYAVLGSSDVVGGLYRDPYKIELAEGAFRECEVTFMVPDHFHLVSWNNIEPSGNFGWQLPKDYTEEHYPYFGKLLTFDELRRDFRKLKIDQFLETNRSRNYWYRYVEAQIWADPKILNVTENQWQEVTPESWTDSRPSLRMTHLQNYKAINRIKEKEASNSSFAS